MEYDFWTMRESPFHQLSDFQCIFLFAFGEVKIICAFVTFSADPVYTSAQYGQQLLTRKFGAQSAPGPRGQDERIGQQERLLAAASGAEFLVAHPDFPRPLVFSKVPVGENQPFQQAQSEGRILYRIPSDPDFQQVPEFSPLPGFGMSRTEGIQQGGVFRITFQSGLVVFDGTSLIVSLAVQIPQQEMGLTLGILPKNKAFSKRFRRFHPSHPCQDSSMQVNNLPVPRLPQKEGFRAF
mgnify:CR=1 FL=1